MPCPLPRGTIKTQSIWVTPSFALRLWGGGGALMNPIRSKWVGALGGWRWGKMLIKLQMQDHLWEGWGAPITGRCKLQHVVCTSPLACAHFWRPRFSIFQLFLDSILQESVYATASHHINSNSSTSYRWSCPRTRPQFGPPHPPTHHRSVGTFGASEVQNNTF